MGMTLDRANAPSRASRMGGMVPCLTCKRQLATHLEGLPPERDRFPGCIFGKGTPSHGARASGCG
eukprot:5001047-Prymnesium_polylepis.1